MPTRALTRPLSRDRQARPVHRAGCGPRAARGGKPALLTGLVAVRAQRGGKPVLLTGLVVVLTAQAAVRAQRVLTGRAAVRV